MIMPFAPFDKITLAEPDSVLEGLLTMGFILVQLVAVVIAGFLLIKILKKIIEKTIRPGKIKNNSILSEKRAQTLRSILTSTVKYAVYFLIVYIVLGLVLGNNANPFLAVAGAVGVALGLGAQDLIKDIIAGFFIVFEDYFSIGDIVEISGQFGTVEEIGLRTTKIRGFSGQLNILPNGAVSSIVNWTKGQAKALLDIRVSYNNNIDKVLAVMEDSLENYSQIDGLEEKPTILGIAELNDYSLTLRIIAGCRTGSNWSVERALRLLILKKFAEEGITLPQPFIMACHSGGVATNCHNGGNNENT